MDPAAVRVAGMDMRAWFVAPGARCGRLVVLVSADGATWRDLTLTVGVPGPGVGAVVADADGVGDDLWLLLRTTNRLGAGTRLLVQPTR